MVSDQNNADIQKTAEEVLGYLNLSSGTTDPRFLSGVNSLYGGIASTSKDSEPGQETPAWRALGRLLLSELERLRGTTKAFAHVAQAEAVVHLVFDHVLPAYRRHHADLCFHQTEASLFQPFFIARACEVVLAEGGPWEEKDHIVRGALRRLNDFLGHRPVAVLETQQRIEPYAHERVRPIPVYIRGAGVAVGPYHDLIAKTLEILDQTDPNLLEQAWFDPERLEELAVDPRAYDFDHPVNKRPNYCFGQWDPHHIDNQGYYRRFVLQQVTLDAILARVEQDDSSPRDERLLEAAAVLAGTMLMGSGVSGDRPETHDSDTTLVTLLAHIARYRDTFYEQLLERIAGAHGKRLRAEAARLQQPLGGARQALNHLLAERRSNQLQHVHLAELYARMGHPETAMRHARIVQVASARMRCEMQCKLTAAHRAIDDGQLEDAASGMPPIEALLHRAIECGAMVDPWNILGFGGYFSLFPAVENSIRDVRVDDLIDLMSAIFALAARLEQEAAAAGKNDLKKRVAAELDRLARWWDQFASIEVSDVSGFTAQQVAESADHVATALGAWHEAGTAAGDIAFWRGRVEEFHSAEAYALVVEALLDKRDPIAAMALLMQWLSQSDEIPLVESNFSFYDLALQWMEDLWRSGHETTGGRRKKQNKLLECWRLSEKFLDYLEAGSEELWEVPRLELDGPISEKNLEEEEEEKEEEPEGGLFEAAYENVVYRDSTDDGFEADMIEGGGYLIDFELAEEADRISEHLAFLRMLAELWKLAATASIGVNNEKRDEVLASWMRRAAHNSRALAKLSSSVYRHEIPAPRGTHESLVEYDQHQAIKETLLDRLINTSVEIADARRLMAATSGADVNLAGGEVWEAPADHVLRAIYAGNVPAVRATWNGLVDVLEEQPLLYQPTSKGGNPQRIVASRGLQQMLCRFLVYLPRLGLLAETCELLETIRKMEREHPVGFGAITEFHDLFEMGYRAMARCLVAGSRARTTKTPPSSVSDRKLIQALEEVSEPLVYRWVVHGRGIRLSVLQPFGADEPWAALRQFIEDYGSDLFTQKFMNFGNLRAIMHQGVDNYLQSLEEMAEEAGRPRLLEDLDTRVSRSDAVLYLGTAIEAVLENYVEYLDYNSITTQSDRGEMLYTLLDFLRLIANYERMAWNLQPLILAHEVMVRAGRATAAEGWQREIAKRTAQTADELEVEYERLCRQYGMRLPSVAERLGQRFVKPMTIDRLRGLIEPAMEEIAKGQPGAAFEQLGDEIDQLTARPSGVGFDVPAWLEALEDEVDRVRSQSDESDNALDPYPKIPQARIPLDEARRQVRDWSEDAAELGL